MLTFSRAIKFLRINEWPKNSVVIFGSIIGLNILQLNLGKITNILLVTLACCLISSANYIINDLYDLEFDRFHPVKKNRNIHPWSKKDLIALSFGLWAVGLGILAGLGNLYVIYLGIALVMHGVLFNIPPVRLKEIPFIDVLFESLTSVIRLLAGWFLLKDSYPRISLLLVIFSYGCVVLFSKRLAELVYLGDKKARLYRKVFFHYNRIILIISAISSMILTLGAILIEFANNIILVSLIMIQLVLLFGLSLKGDPVAQNPVKIYKSKRLFLLSIAIIIVWIFSFMNPELY